MKVCDSDGHDMIVALVYCMQKHIILHRLFINKFFTNLIQWLMKAAKRWVALDSDS